MLDKESLFSEVSYQGWKHELDTTKNNLVWNTTKPIKETASFIWGVLKAFPLWKENNVLISIFHHHFIFNYVLYDVHAMYLYVSNILY